MTGRLQSCSAKAAKNHVGLIEKEERDIAKSAPNRLGVRGNIMFSEKPIVKFSELT